MKRLPWSNSRLELALLALFCLLVVGMFVRAIGVSSRSRCTVQEDAGFHRTGHNPKTSAVYFHPRFIVTSDSLAGPLLMRVSVDRPGEAAGRDAARGYPIGQPFGCHVKRFLVGSGLHGQRPKVIATPEAEHAYAWVLIYESVIALLSVAALATLLAIVAGLARRGFAGRGALRRS